MTDTTTTDAEIITRAEALGADAGRAAASWVFDGNTDRATYARVLAGIEDGDPEVMDAYREPDLSGEFSGAGCEAGLAVDLGIEPYSELSDDACRAWDEAARAAFWAEIEKTARAALA
jgi:hypothetical protein